MNLVQDILQEKVRRWWEGGGKVVGRWWEGGGKDLKLEGSRNKSASVVLLPY